jgi:hypothetical protein
LWKKFLGARISPLEATRMQTHVRAHAKVSWRGVWLALAGVQEAIVLSMFLHCRKILSRPCRARIASDDSSSLRDIVSAERCIAQRVYTFR